MPGLKSRSTREKVQGRNNMTTEELRILQKKLKERFNVDVTLEDLQTNVSNILKVVTEIIDQAEIRAWPNERTK